ncbi:LysR family transcriptional regulator [Ferrimonas marina]|uniref:DNA-binding transcriptional regulator, LysR family n=1 Tax=Ferrimonas marina TaxID=299255 RepID=A0A1M5VFP5_9GAMM|nr:LysR family transcriptional regulator [Ferrimonas marina]SHH73733.1 DNA-binding transcriptional regulator, LysR family [Ferrimonas marina]
MKLDDLKLFVAVARAPGLREAARQLGQSPGTVSKAIKRIETHYQQALFRRQGWALTEAGKMLFVRALELAQTLDKIDGELGQPRRRHLRISGSQALLSQFVAPILARLDTPVSVETQLAADLVPLARHQVDLALLSTLSGERPQGREWQATELAQAQFVTVARPGHPLLSDCSEAVPIDRVLQQPFVVPAKPIYGQMSSQTSLDGWYDEPFHRQIRARVEDVATLVSLVKATDWLAYVPDYLAQSQGLAVLPVSGCPYTCEQVIWLCQPKPAVYHWLAPLSEGIAGQTDAS